VTERTKLCVALDSADATEIRRLAAATAGAVDLYKIGLTAFVANGPDLVRELAELKPVFLDLKLHDIPAQVAGAVRAAAATGAKYVTVHAAGGREMIAAAADAAGGRVDILAVTILTSLDDRALDQVGVGGPLPAAVSRLADLAVRAGATGLVCSPLEVATLRRATGPRDGGGVTLVVPGIRASGDSPDDQKRTLSAREASVAGADIVVVGRPITSASDPGAAARDIAGELELAIGAGA
jgi:orotidine-5'-phosphate decarboxylase